MPFTFLNAHDHSFSTLSEGNFAFLCKHCVFTFVLQTLCFTFVLFFCDGYLDIRRNDNNSSNNKSNRKTMRPLGIYRIGISMYILNMIHFLMILADFVVFSLMVTDGRTYGRTDIRTDRSSYRDARTHLKTTS